MSLNHFNHGEKRTLSDAAMRVRLLAFAIEHRNEHLFYCVKRNALDLLQQHYNEIAQRTNERFNDEFFLQDADHYDFASNNMTLRILKRAIGRANILPKHMYYLADLYMDSQNVDQLTTLCAMRDNKELAECYFKLKASFYYKYFLCADEMRSPDFPVKEEEMPQRLQMVEYALFMNDPNLAMRMLREAPIAEVQSALNARNPEIIKLGRAALYSKIYREHLLDVVNIRLNGVQAANDAEFKALSQKIIKLEKSIPKLDEELARKRAPKRPLPNPILYRAKQIADKLACVTTEPPMVVKRKKK